MIATLVVSALLAAELAVASVPGPDIIIEEQKPAAYKQLRDGRMDEGIAAIEAALVKDPGDPALLINLAYGYARLGRLEKAADAYRAAMASSTRYELELASGRWDDSHRIAQTGLRSIEAKVQVAALDR